jgi:hypothetical protein
MGLEDELREEMADHQDPSEDRLNPEALSEDERFRLILGRLDGIQRGIYRLARRLEQR